MTLTKIVLSNLREYLSDRKETKFGTLFSHRPNIAPQAYLIKINKPALPDQIDRLAGFAKGISNHYVRNMLLEFNGMNLFMSTFTIFGHQGAVERGDLLDVQNIPFDSIPFQTYDRPKFAPHGYVLGTYTPSAAVDKCYVDLIEPDGRVVSGEFYNNSVITDRFEAIEEWLVARIYRSKNDYEKASNLI